MSRPVYLVNDHHGIVDLSMVSDVLDKPVVLRPKGLSGSTRECFPEALQHPHVQKVIHAKWVHVDHRDVAPPLKVLEDFKPSAPRHVEPPAPVKHEQLPVQDAVAVAAAPPEMTIILDEPDLPTPAPAPAPAPAPVPTSESRKGKRRY